MDTESTARRPATQRPHRSTATDRDTALLHREHDRLHELRATVGGLAAAHQLLGGGRDLPIARRRQLERLFTQELGRLTRLVEDDEVEPTSEVDLDLAIEPLVEALRLRGLHVTWHGAATGVWGRADGITEILHILLDNSARHGAGGVVDVTAVSRDSFVDVHVLDQGPGVSPEVADRVFRRGVHRAGSPGSGLGLSIAHRHAVEMGGRLRLAPSVPGRGGAEFVLTLPSTGRWTCHAESR